MPDFKRENESPISLSHSLNINHMLFYYTSLTKPPFALSDPSFTLTHTPKNDTMFFFFPRRPQPHQGMKAHLDFPDPEDVLHPMLMRESDLLCCAGALPGLFFAQSCLSLRVTF